MTAIALGVDLSSRYLHCAYGMADQPLQVRLRVSGDNATQRIESITDQMDALFARLETHLGPFDRALMLTEQPFLNRNPRTPIALGMLVGALVASAYRHGWMSTVEDPSDIRKAILGQGTARPAGEIKRIAQRWVMCELGLPVSEDEADAIVIWSRAKGLVAAL